MTAHSEFWGTLRSLCASEPYAYNVENIAYHLDDAALAAEERDAAIDHAGQAIAAWPEEERLKAQLPYTPWMLALCTRLLEAEANGKDSAFEDAARILDAFKPNAVPLLAARKRKRLRQLAGEEGWQAIAKEWGTSQASHQDLIRSLQRLDPRSTLLHTAEIIDRDGQGEYKYVLLSERGAFDKLCALQVLWEVMPKEAREAVGVDVLDFFWGMAATLAYDLKESEHSPTRASPYADLIHLKSRPLMRGFGQPIEGQDDLIQVILSGLRCFEAMTPTPPSLERLRMLASGAGVAGPWKWSGSLDHAIDFATYWEEPRFETYQGLLNQTSSWEDLDGCYLIDEPYDGYAWSKWQPSNW